jgi:hypothetical protein
MIQSGIVSTDAFVKYYFWRMTEVPDALHSKHFNLGNVSIVAYCSFAMEAKERHSRKAEQIATIAISISEHQRRVSSSLKRST